MIPRTLTRSRRGPRALITATALLAVGALTACSAGGPGGEAEEVTDSGKALEQVTVALPGSLANLYVGQESGVLNYYLASTVQEGLVGLDADGTLVPALAETWDTPDANTYVFTLRSDAVFHNGDPVTPEDVVFSLLQAKDATASPGLTWYLSNMKSVEKTGEQQVTVVTAEPDPAFIKNMTTAGATFVTQEKHWQEVDGAVGTADSLLLGSGPYAVTDFTPGESVTLERSDDWWGTPGKAESIRVEFIPDENTRLLAAQSGDIDIAFNVPLKQAQQWQESAGLRVDSVNDLSYVGLLFDQNVAPFDDLKVREAIAHSVDREAIVEKLLRGYGEAASTIMTPESITDQLDAEAARKLLASVPQLDFDLDAAKQALSESSVPEGFTAELAYPNTGPHLGTAAQSLAENLKQVGITLSVKEQPIETWLAGIGTGENGLGLMWYFSTTGDPAEVSSYLLAADNVNHVESEEMLGFFREANTAQTPEERLDLLMQAETLNAEQVINAPLWWGQSLTAFSDRVGIAEFSPYTFLGPWGAELFAAE